MDLTGWGNFPIIKSEVIDVINIRDVIENISDASKTPLIARGLGRSYGDSSLAPHVMRTIQLDHFLKFDETSGSLNCSAGVSFADILSVFVPKGWFLPVTPGTKFITVGGAVASDVHGKNHHLEGCFGDHVSSLKIATASNGIIECSREHNPELFQATCGGMGLTGVILEATFKLKSIQSAYINTTTIKAKNLEEVLSLFDAHHQTTYSVAWLDCASTGKLLGRSLLKLGEHADKGKFTTGKNARLVIPVDMPGFLLNRYAIKAFNFFYYNRVSKQQLEHLAHYESFFYPLDAIRHWNRLYGKNGFTQYQLVLPREAGLEGMTAVLQRIAASKRGSFLAVLKAFGKGNDNYLSFPMEGYTLALDFKLDKGLFGLLDELDSIVLDHGGRLYLTKDVRMSEEMFKKSYRRWGEFMKVRTQYDADRVFHSLQSHRLGI
jgi:FAD/FMN-containing dehydrogenase